MNIYNMNPRRLGELIEEVITELGGDEAVQDLIRKEKASIIDDIFRGSKIAQLYDARFKDELEEPVQFFDKLYELDLHTLEAYSKALDKRNTEYMRAQVAKHNSGADFWKPFDNNFMM